MHILQSIILGVVEGMTEFLPISSTFHMIFASKFLGVPQNEFSKMFEVIIQPGAILSVILLYFREVINDFDLIKKTLAAFIPTAIIGLILYKIIKDVFFASPILMLTVFIAVGVVFIVFEYLVKKEKIRLDKKISALSYKDAILIGLIQALAVIPGVSRAGAVIVGMMALKYRRDEAAKFSFILAVPTIFAASFLDIYKGRDYLLHHNADDLTLLIGFITAFISSYFVVKWFIGFLKNNSLIGFGIYRFAVAILLLLFTLK